METETAARFPGRRAEWPWVALSATGSAVLAPRPPASATEEPAPRGTQPRRSQTWSAGARQLPRSRCWLLPRAVPSCLNPPGAQAGPGSPPPPSPHTLPPPFLRPTPPRAPSAAGGAPPPSGAVTSAPGPAVSSPGALFQRNQPVRVRARVTSDGLINSVSYGHLSQA